ncbi:MAG: ribonuclease III [Clostridia bacterium]|nr:ribonuclease III [Clostridia bacterium]
MDIGYNFNDKALLELALTHISFANDTKRESNQRLEFLGDSVLSHIIAMEIYKLFPKCDEGELTKIRASLVCEKSLAQLSRELDLGSGIKFGRSEKMSDGKHKDSILADTFEAVLGAIYLDSGFEQARDWTLKTFGDKIKNVQVISEINYKSELQIYFQKRDKGSEVVNYRLISKTGPDHDPMFYVEAIYKNKVIGKGSGKTLKHAEQNAAKMAFEGMENKNEKV